MGQLNVQVWAWLWHLYFICKFLNLETYPGYRLVWLLWPRSSSPFTDFTQFKYPRRWFHRSAFYFCLLFVAFFFLREGLGYPRLALNFWTSSLKHWETLTATPGVKLTLFSKLRSKVQVSLSHWRGNPTSSGMKLSEVQELTAPCPGWISPHMLNA